MRSANGRGGEPVAPALLAAHAAMTTKRFHLDRTDTSPQIDLDLDNGVMEFVGRSLPNNSELFYSRVYRWLEEYLEAPREETTVNMRLDYLDTSSSKHLYNIFQKLDAVNERGQHVRVNWHFETGDEEMAETGKDYESLFRLNFNFVEVQELF
jgi:hypothetical protein